MTDPGMVPEYPGKGSKYVLIVEKDPLQGYLLKVFLMEEGWAVCLVEDPVEALSCCEHDLFDIALINSHYPGSINGFVLAEQLQDDYHLPSLMITASRNCELKSIAAFNPNQELLYKPYRLMECGPRLHQLLAYRSKFREHGDGNRK
jgi:DNA-binding response OmpR family regulator